MKKIIQFIGVLFFVIFAFNNLNCMQKNNPIFTEEHSIRQHLEIIKNHIGHFYHRPSKTLDLSSHALGFKLTNDNLMDLFPTIYLFVERCVEIIDLTNNDLKLDYRLMFIIGSLLHCNVKIIHLEGNPIHFSFWNKLLINFESSSFVSSQIYIQDFLDTESGPLNNELILNLGPHKKYKVQEIHIDDTKFNKIKPIICKWVISGTIATAAYLTITLINNLL